MTVTEPALVHLPNTIKKVWVINEINGNLDEAVDRAREAYATYGNRQAFRYLRVLEYRKSQNQMLEAQLIQADW